MRTLRLVVAAALLAGAAAVSRAQDLAQLFPEEADVLAPAAGLVRLPLPAHVLTTCAPDLSDLRLFDREGHEVPYLLDSGTPPGDTARESRAVDARVLDLTREELPRDDRLSLTREVYRLTWPQTPPAGETWTLAVESARPRFVRNVEVQGIDAEGKSTVLVARASLVRLGQALVDRTRVVLPPFAGGELVVTIEGEEGFFLEPTWRYESARTLAPGDAIAVPLAVLGRRRDAGRTVVEVARPPGLVPVRVRIATTTLVFDRALTVWDADAAGATRRVATGRLVRAPLAPPSVRGDAAPVERLELDVGVAHGDRLRLDIDDGDSPPLADVEVTAVVRQPALVFALPAAPADAPAGLLRFGGGRAWRPRYDLATLFTDVAAAGGARLDEATALAVARLGPHRRNARFDDGPLLAAVMRPGPALEIRAWRWRRALAVPASPEGLARFRLAPDDLAHARPDLGDLRVADGEHRQWPYVVAPATARETIVLGIGTRTGEDGVSRWPLLLPAAPLVVDELVLTPQGTVLHRPYRVVTRDGHGEERVLARGTIVQDPRRPVPVRIAFGPVRVERLELVIEDGDNAPLVPARVESALALPDLLLAAPAGSYELLAGNPDATAPDYELARARATVLGLRTVAAVPAAARENPDWDAGAGPGALARHRARLQQVAVGVALALAVLVLAAVTLRMVRGEKP